MMKVVKDQTIYQCEYCGKRLLSKNGAKIHERQYCQKSPIVKKTNEEKIVNCDHVWETVWDYIPGECVKEPDHDECVKCLVKKTDWERMKSDVAKHEISNAI